MNDDEMTLVIGDCPFCGTEVAITTDKKTAMHIDAWLKTPRCEREAVQNEFPQLSATTREILITCICPDCQKRIFGA